MTQVRVVKPFKALRTPCPKIGTVGQVVDGDEAGWVYVEFWEFQDAHEGLFWGPGVGDGSEPFVLKFKPDELEPVRP